MIKYIFLAFLFGEFLNLTTGGVVEQIGSTYFRCRIGVEGFKCLFLEQERMRV